MGLNICIQTTSGKDHPDWDDSKGHGDREFIQTYWKEIEWDRWEPEGFPWLNSDFMERPKNFAAFRMIAVKCDNPERWLHAADILESNPDYWIYLSV